MKEQPLRFHYLYSKTQLSNLIINMTENKYEPLTKCLCTNTWIDYIKAQGWNTEGLYDGLGYDEEYMCDVENWMPSGQVYKFSINITGKFHEGPELFYRMGIWAAKNRTVGALYAMARSFIDPGSIYDRLPKYIENFNKHMKMEIVERSKNKALLNTYHMTEVTAIKEICEWTRGLIAAAPCVLNLPTAEAKETLCELNGDECCQYEVVWTKRRNILVSIWEKTLGQKKIIEEQRLALEKDQEKLLEHFEERMRLKHALDLAMEVQQSLLPRSDPTIEGLDIAGKSIYCDETGGDYYDFLYRGKHGQRKIGVLVGDVSEHGIPAALLMTTARASLRQRSSMSGSIARIVSAVNRQLSHDVEETGRFMTLFYGEIDTENKSLRWVNAGHDPGIIYDSSSDTFEELGGRGLPLGVFEDSQYRESHREITPGQIIVIGTDGVWEARNPTGEMFGKSRLKEIIRAHATEPAKQILDAVIRESEQFRNPLSIEDDFTLVVVKVEQ